MNFLDRVSRTLSESLDFIIDKNRHKAQLNRINAVIQNETDILNRAYVALGKHYYKTLDGKTEDVDVSPICDTIKSAKLRLKKAKARYEYTLKYGVPTPGIRDDLSVACIEEEESKAPACECEKKVPAAPAQEEEQDITIAYAEPEAPAESVEEKIEAAAETLKPEE